LRIACSVRPNSVGAYLPFHLKMAIYPVSETLCPVCNVRHPTKSGPSHPEWKRMSSGGRLYLMNKSFTPAVILTEFPLTCL
jgi:hypothetical protein